MVLSSVVFLFRFLPLFFLLYFLLPERMRNLVLFFGSLYFYAWGEPVYVFLMLFSTVSDYLHGLWIEKYRGQKAALWFLVSSLTINLGLLSFFKYSGLNLPLPIGISFYTFQTMSYSIDVYRGEIPAQKNILLFGVYVTMFPQLVAGPIVKYSEIQNELSHRQICIRDISAGICRFCIGLAKKVLLANRIGLLFTEITALKFEKITFMSAWMAVIAYAFQIYFDFSGYSDMAIGLGKMMGFTFPENFNYPYIACSITDFWRRWHISLSSWFREYVYVPLGGNRKGKIRQLFNILVVWSLTGIWHGAGIHFLLWGMWFALFLILEKLFLGKILKKMPSFAGWVYTMAVVLVSWSFFAIEDNHLLKQILTAMTGLAGKGLCNREALYFWENYKVTFLLLILCCIPFWRNMFIKWKEVVKNSTGMAGIFLKGFLIILECVYLSSLFFLSTSGIVDASYNPFLYFRF